MIMTPEINALFKTGYSPFAVLRFDPNFPGKFSIYRGDVLPMCLRSALSRKADRLIQAAMNWSVSVRN
jgi:hypothetical protein